jgi:hypothetical protein
MIIAYHQVGKRKGESVCRAFVAGYPHHTMVSETNRNDLLDPKQDCVAFYGLSGTNKPIWEDAKRRGLTWFCIDNSYFDRTRGEYFRVTRNAPQVNTLQSPDYARAEAQGIQIAPWTFDGEHILVVEQSGVFMREVAGFKTATEWRETVREALRKATHRRVQVRAWDRNKLKAGASFPAQLAGAHCLVTHSSAAANEALLAGVPVLVLSACAASPLSTKGFDEAEFPLRAENRLAWAAGLAGCQWTLQEMETGLTWRKLNGK